MMKQVNIGRILLLGIGSDILRDVGITSRLINDLRARLPYEEIDYHSIYLGGLDLLEYIDGYRAVIFIDTIKTMKGDPGKIHFFSPENYWETLHLSNRHDLSFSMTLELGKKLGFTLPVIMHVIAIEITEDLEIGTGLSEELNERYPEIRAEVERRIDKIYKETRMEI